MEANFVLDFKSDVVFEEKMQKDSTVNQGKKMLADISNMPRRPSNMTQDNKHRPNSAHLKEYIEQLQKENVALMKLLADKNRIIDISGAELYKLRISLQKMQQQNLHLARSNTQMLAELNFGRDRLKDLQHQLGCKNGLLIAKQLELEGKRKNKTCEASTIKKLKVSEQGETGVCMVAEKDKSQNSNIITRQKSKSLGPSVRKVQEKGVGDNGRFQARRQSARFKDEEPKPIKDLFHTDDAHLPPCHDWNSVAFSVKKEDEEKVVTQERRSSISRPSRVAAKKVQSYKEISLHVKLRRPE